MQKSKFHSHKTWENGTSLSLSKPLNKAKCLPPTLPRVISLLEMRVPWARHPSGCWPILRNRLTAKGRAKYFIASSSAVAPWGLPSSTQGRAVTAKAWRGGARRQCLRPGAATWTSGRHRVGAAGGPGPSGGRKPWCCCRELHYSAQLSCWM